VAEAGRSPDATARSAARAISARSSWVSTLQPDDADPLHVVDVDGVHKPNLVRGRGHHQRVRADPAAEQPDAAEEVAVRDARGGEHEGVSADEMIECELIPEARGLVDFFVRSWIDIPLAECFAVHMEEEIFGFISRDFRQSLPKYGVSNDDMKYFRVHEEADLDEDHGGTNQAILEVALQEGYGNERAGWPLEYCGRIAVQMIGNFYEGVYRRYA